MPQKLRDDVTSLIAEANAGEPGARDALGLALYETLRDIATGFIRRERRDHTLRPDDLVNEAMVRLLDGAVLRKAMNRRYVYAAAIRAMRQILVDHHRKRNGKGRSKYPNRVPLEGVAIAAKGPRIEDADLHEALERLSRLHERQAKVVKLKFFGGLTIDEIAVVLSVAASTVEEDWRAARAYLFLQLRETTG